MNYREFKNRAIAHLDELYAFAVRRTRSRPEAEDMVHNAYVRAFSRWRQLKNPDSMRAWLFQILRHGLINERNRASRSPILKVVSSDESIDLLRRESILLPEEILDRILPSEVEEMLDQLPDSLKEPVILADIWGFSYVDIGNIMDCPVGTVRSRLHRARAALATKLEALSRSQGMRGPSKGKRDFSEGSA